MKSHSLSRLGAAILFGSIAAFSPLVGAEVVVTQSAGTISQFSPDSLVITSETATAPTSYVISKEVAYVDDSGAPVSVEVIKSGAPVTVHYVREADRVVARRVIVHRRAATAVRPSTTTTVRPAIVEERPVVVERKPVVVEERRAVVPAPQVIEKKTTTTTTTSTEKD